MFGKDKIKGAFTIYSQDLGSLNYYDSNLSTLEKLEKRISLLEQFIQNLKKAFD